MEKNLGPQKLVTAGGGWSAIIHPFNNYLAGAHTGPEEKLVVGEIDLDQLKFVKVWVDSSGHYARPEVLKMQVNKQPLWHDETVGTPTGFEAFETAVAADAEM